MFVNAQRDIREQNFERKGYDTLVDSDGAKVLSHYAYTELNHRPASGA